MTRWTAGGTKCEPVQKGLCSSVEVSIHEIRYGSDAGTDGAEMSVNFMPRLLKRNLLSRALSGRPLTGLTYTFPGFDVGIGD